MFAVGAPLCLVAIERLLFFKPQELSIQVDPNTGQHSPAALVESSWDMAGLIQF